MDTIFLNAQNSKTSYLQRLIVDLPDKINLKMSDNILL